MEPIEENATKIDTTDNIVEVERNEEEKKQEAQIMDGIWDNFKSYTESLKLEIDKVNTNNEEEIEFLKSVILAEHDYWIVYADNTEINGENREKTYVENDLTKSPIQVKIHLMCFCS